VVVAGLGEQLGRDEVGLVVDGQCPAQLLSIGSADKVVDGVDQARQHSGGAL
jgi:hypothetical protein